MCPRNSLALFNRREWLKIFLLGTAASRVLGSNQTFAQQSVLTGLVPSNSSAIIPIRLSDFPVLQIAGGTLGLTFSAFRYPLYVTRSDKPGETNVFYALDPTCTHQGCQIEPYFTPYYYYCTCHGSEYDIQGHVIQGAVEGQANLTAYRTAFDGSNLVEVELAGVPLRVDDISVQSRTVSNTRLKLQFPGVSGCTYQARHYADFNSPPELAFFSTTANGNADQATLQVPQAGDGVKTIWVDVPEAQGFFTIELVLSEYSF